MTLQRHFETIRATACLCKVSLNPLLLCATLFAVTALFLSPSVASASPRDGHREAFVITPVDHPRHHYRHGRAYDRHYQIRGDSRRKIEHARRYASQATAQASAAWRLGCARSGPRWSTDWNDHYFWALNAGPRDLRRELDRRDHRLRDCRIRRHHGHRSYRPH